MMEKTEDGGDENKQKTKTKVKKEIDESGERKVKGEKERGEQSKGGICKDGWEKAMMDVRDEKRRMREVSSENTARERE